VKRGNSQPKRGDRAAGRAAGHTKHIGNAGDNTPSEAIFLTLTGMAPKGEALGRHEGLVIFVAGGLPGEVVRVQIIEQHTSWARASLLEVLQPAPERVAARCRHFDRCGGCNWQHVEYTAQLAFKTNIVREQMARIARLPDANVRDCLGSPSPYGYRNTARLAVAPDGRVGYRMPASHEVLAIEECPILEPALQQELGELRGLRLDPGDEVVLRVPAEPLRVGKFDYFVSIDSFFQVNSAMAGQLVNEVMAALALEGGESVLDLYAGVGLFTLPIAAAVGRQGRVLAIESSPSAVADGRRNAAAFPQVAWLEARVEEGMARPEVAATGWQRLLLDPPRRGVDRDALRAMAALRAAVIVYVSCDPATLARDTQLLGEHGYRLHAAQPLDLFPQTAHVETVARFVLDDSTQ